MILCVLFGFPLKMLWLCCSAKLLLCFVGLGMSRLSDTNTMSHHLIDLICHIVYRTFMYFLHSINNGSTSKHLNYTTPPKNYRRGAFAVICFRWFRSCRDERSCGPRELAPQNCSSYRPSRPCDPTTLGLDILQALRHPRFGSWRHNHPSLPGIHLGIHAAPHQMPYCMPFRRSQWQSCF